MVWHVPFFGVTRIFYRNLTGAPGVVAGKRQRESERERVEDCFRNKRRRKSATGVGEGQAVAVGAVTGRGSGEEAVN